MQSVTVVRCGASARMDRLLEKLSLPPGSRTLSSEDWIAAGTEAEPNRLLLFAVCVDSLGPAPAFAALLRFIRGLGTGLRGRLSGVVVSGDSELDTKAVGRRLIFTLNCAGCAFPERPLAEATGSMRNLRILQRHLGLTAPEDAFLAAAGSLLDRMQDFRQPQFRQPRLLVLHASDHATSNTLNLGELILRELDSRFETRILSLRNGAIEDCRGCSYKICSHYASKSACFYGGSITHEVLPAVRDCDALLLLLPNYNDSVGANIMAFINRLTSLHVNNELSGRSLYAVVVSGYSGGELVATQAMGALCLNKAFLLSPGFCMLETANDPGEILRQPGIAERAAAFARHMERQLLL